jgi:hypothetical protein
MFTIGEPDVPGAIMLRYRSTVQDPSDHPATHLYPTTSAETGTAPIAEYVQ